MYPNEMPRCQQLRKMTKPELCALYRQLGHVWSANPLERWTKEELIGSILEVEFHEQREEARATGPEHPGACRYGGPAAVDTSKPYAYRAERSDGVKEWSYSSGTQTAPEENGPTCSLEVAQRAVEAVRIGHGYYGPLRVSVWAHRIGDGMTVPDDAEWFEFGANPLLEKWRAKQQETSA